MLTCIDAEVECSKGNPVWMLAEKRQQIRELLAVIIKTRIHDPKIRLKTTTWNAILDSLANALIDTDLTCNTAQDIVYDWFSQELINRKSFDLMCDKFLVYFHLYDIYNKAPASFFQATESLHDNLNGAGKNSSIISEDYYKFAMNLNRSWMDNLLQKQSQHDYEFDHFGLVTLEQTFLKHDTTKSKRLLERPVHLNARIATMFAMHGQPKDQEKVKRRIARTFSSLSKKEFTFSSPTIKNAGCVYQQLNSCFLIAGDGTFDGNIKLLRDSLTIDKTIGGQGIFMGNNPVTGTVIDGTGNKECGADIVHIFSTAIDTVKTPKRPAKAFYYPMWHGDIPRILEKLDITSKDDKNTVRNLYFAFMIPHLFMRRFLANEEWSLMCPSVCPKLINTWGDEFEKHYLEYESQGKYIQKVSARKMMESIYDRLFEGGKIFLLYSDTINELSNQNNLGMIKFSNLCTEIVQYSEDGYYSVCTLASLCLPKFVKYNAGQVYFDYDHLLQVTKLVAKNLDRCIDINYFPVPETVQNTLDNRNIGIGIQGLADVFNMFGCAFDSQQARDLNIAIQETIYYAAISQSCKLARKHGPYKYFPGSPISKGLFQFDLWKQTSRKVKHSGLYDWESLRRDVMQYGVRNAQMIANMPTSVSAGLNGNSESFDPLTNCIFVRNIELGQFTIVNSNLYKDLTALGLWETTHKKIKQNFGSVQDIPEIPQSIKDVYKTVWEIKLPSLITLAAERGPFVDQTQSFNCYLMDPTYNIMSNWLVRSWELGLKTGCYYLRTHQKDLSSAVDLYRSEEGTKPTEQLVKKVEVVGKVCNRDDPTCEACSA